MECRHTINKIKMGDIWRRRKKMYMLILCREKTFKKMEHVEEYTQQGNIAHRSKIKIKNNMAIKLVARQKMQKS